MQEVVFEMHTPLIHLGYYNKPIVSIMLKTPFNSFMIGLVLITSLSACSITREVETVRAARVVNPNSINIPVLKAQGDIIVSGKVSGSPTQKRSSDVELFILNDRREQISIEKPISGIELQGSWAFGSRFALMANYDGVIVKGNKSSFAEFGLGYWSKQKLTTLADLQLSSNFFAGYGYGSRDVQIDLRKDKITYRPRSIFNSLLSTPPRNISTKTIGNFSGDYHRFFIQSSFIWSYKKILDWGVVARLAQYHIPDFTKEINGNRRNERLSFTTLEPVLFCNAGSEKVKFIAQLQFLGMLGSNNAYSSFANDQEGEFAPSSVKISGGVSFFFSRKK
ncbi:MAG: hypothetical protein AB8F95_19035 [Bacteroidia bacterium]